MNATKPLHHPEPQAPGGRERFARLRELWRRLRGIASPARAGLSVALGVFIGCLPLYGFHLPLCLAVCVPLRLDAVLAYLGANVSNPLVAPALLALEVEVGSLVLTGQFRNFRFARGQERELLVMASELAVGSVVVGLVLGALLGAIAYAIGRSRAPNAPLAAAIRRTRARYRGAAAGDRFYVAGKLRFDPVLASIAALGPLGAVVDAGAGRGQLALALLELGHAGSVSGFDFDERKVAVANAAARGDARFDVGDLRSAELRAADTILLVDVLHYLPAADQDALLARARAAIGPGGRLVVRDVDTTRRSWFSRVLERVLSRFGYNRAAGALEFRSPERILERLRALGLECRDEDAAGGTPFENRLIVAVSPPAQASSNSLQNSTASTRSSSSSR